MKEKTPYDLLMEYERAHRPKRSTKEIKRSWIRPKKREKKTLWRTGQHKEDSRGMAALRSHAYRRSEGICECSKIPKKYKQCCGKKGCGKIVTWEDGQLHHFKSRAHGGSDIASHVRFITRACHDEITGKPQWSRPLLPEFAEIFHYKKPVEKVSSEPAREEANG